MKIRFEFLKFLRKFETLGLSSALGIHVWRFNAYKAAITVHSQWRHYSIPKFFGTAARTSLVDCVHGAGLVYSQNAH